MGILSAFYCKESAAPSVSLHAIPTACLKTREPGRRLKLSWITQPKPTWNGGQSRIILSIKAGIFTFISGVCCCQEARASFTRFKRNFTSFQRAHNRWGSCSRKQGTFWSTSRIKQFATVCVFCVVVFFLNTTLWQDEIFFAHSSLKDTHAERRHISVAPEQPDLRNNLVQGWNRKRVRAFPDAATQILHASAITIKEEQINFGGGGYGLV